MRARARVRVCVCVKFKWEKFLQKTVPDVIMAEQIENQERSRTMHTVISVSCLLHNFQTEM